MLDSPPQTTPNDRATILLLLVIAGCVDAVGLGELGRYFVSYMSGNTTQIGMLIGSGDRAGALLPLGLIALFVAGATIGTLLAEGAGRRAPAILLLTEAALLAAAYIGFGSMRPMLGAILLPVAMGLANIVTLRAGGPHPGTTYATGALVKLGIGLAGLGRDADPRDVLFHAAMWLALLVGSLFGAFGRLRFGDAVLLGPVIVLVVLGVVDFVATKRPAG